MTKRLARVGIGKMNLNCRHATPRNRISDRQTCVGQRTCVNDNNAETTPRTLDPADQFALSVALTEVNLHPDGGSFIPNASLDLPQSQLAVDFGLSCPEQIQVGSIQVKDFHFEQMLSAGCGRVDVICGFAT